MGKLFKRTERKEGASVYELSSPSQCYCKKCMEKTTYCSVSSSHNAHCYQWQPKSAGFGEFLLSLAVRFQEGVTWGNSTHRSARWREKRFSVRTLLKWRIIHWIRQNIKYAKVLICYLNLLMFFSETLIKRTIGYILALIKSFVQLIPASRRQCLF